MANPKPKRPKVPEAPEKAIRRHINRILAQKSRGPRFVVELTSSVRNATHLEVAEIEAVMQTMVVEGAVIVRPKTHADPHLAGLDLRIVAPIIASEEDNGLEAAEAAVESLWGHWTAQWAAKHVCDAP
jgi:hypothetical protein